ncbi:hypothetical protein GOV13_02500 [Candidatus Pacearchaeota archaeon]|nr:hypothetical protein [Candidatus Pacearchaeota archaeon]
MAQVIELPSNGELKDMYAEHIDHTQAYDSKVFVPTFNRDSKLEQNVAGLKEDPKNSGLIKDVSKILYNRDDAFANLPNSGEVARENADRFLSKAIDPRALYVKNNLDDFIDLADGNQMLNLAMSLPLYKTDDESHNKLVDSINEMRVIQDAGKDFSKMSQYVDKKLEKIPAWLQESIDYYSGNQEYISAVFKQFAGFAQNRFQKETHLFLVENGQIKSSTVNKGKLETAFRDSLNKAWEMHNDEPIPKKKNDIWEEKIRDSYLTLARTVYPKEEKGFDLDRDAKAVKREEDRDNATVIPYPVKKAA